MSAVTISAVELMALKKLALISSALAATFDDRTAARELNALTLVLIDVVKRHEIANPTK